MRYRLEALTRRLKAYTPAGAPPAENRRRELRQVVDAGTRSARLLGGLDITLRNVSRRGMLFESPLRLLVGSPTVLRLRTGGAWVELTGRVARSQVVTIQEGRVRFETALHLDQDCPLPALAALVGVSSEGEVTLIEPPDTLDPGASIN